MSVSAPVSLKEYFVIDTKPYFEYVNGELVQKTVPSNLHCELQAWLGYIMIRELGLPRYRVLIECSLRVSETVVRIPGLCVVADGCKADKYCVIEPPSLCVEIFSPGDNIPATVAKCRDYLYWGVQSCWILDPDLEEAWDITLTDMDIIPPDGVLQAGSISISMKDVFQSNQ